MQKKDNFRAHKRALKKSKQRNNRNVVNKQNKRLQREHDESFLIQMDALLDELTMSIRKLKNKIVVKRALFSYDIRFLFRKKEKKIENIDFYSLVNSFSLHRQISISLACFILFNCLGDLCQNVHAARTLDTSTIDILENMAETTKYDSLIEKEVDNMTEDPAIIEDEILVTMEKVQEQIENEKQQMIAEQLREPTLEEKVAIILDKYNITEYQFIYIVATVILEAGKALIGDEINYYDECYNVISTMFNRASSISCINFVDGKLGTGTGTNIYNQASCPGQYTVSREAIAQLLKEDLSIYSAYYAVVDMLYTGQPSTDFYRFASEERNFTNGYGGVQLSPPYGNYYFAKVRDYDRISLRETLPNFAKYQDEYEEREKLRAEYEQEPQKVMTLSPIGNQVN